MTKKSCCLTLFLILFLISLAGAKAYAATVTDLENKCNECWGYNNYSESGCEVKYPYDTHLSGDTPKSDLKCNLKLALFCATKELPDAPKYRAYCGTDKTGSNIALRRIFFSDNIQYHYLDTPIYIKGEVTPPNWLPMPLETGDAALEAYKKNIPFITIDGVGSDNAVAHIAPSEEWKNCNYYSDNNEPCPGLAISKDNAANIIFKNLVFENFYREAIRILSDKHTLTYKSVFISSEKKYQYYPDIVLAEGVVFQGNAKDGKNASVFVVDGSQVFIKGVKFDAQGQDFLQQKPAIKINGGKSWVSLHGDVEFNNFPEKVGVIKLDGEAKVLAPEIEDPETYPVTGDNKYTVRLWVDGAYMAPTCDAKDLDEVVGFNRLYLAKITYGNEGKRSYKHLDLHKLVSGSTQCKYGPNTDKPFVNSMELIKSGKLKLCSGVTPKEGKYCVEFDVDKTELTTQGVDPEKDDLAWRGQDSYKGNVSSFSKPFKMQKITAEQKKDFGDAIAFFLCKAISNYWIEQADGTYKCMDEKGSTKNKGAITYCLEQGKGWSEKYLGGDACMPCSEGQNPLATGECIACPAGESYGKTTHICTACTDPEHMDDKCSCLDTTMTKTGAGQCLCSSDKFFDEDIGKCSVMAPKSGCSDPLKMDETCHCFADLQTDDAGLCQCIKSNQIFDFTTKKCGCSDLMMDGNCECPAMATKNAEGGCDCPADKPYKIYDQKTCSSLPKACPDAEKMDEFCNCNAPLVITSAYKCECPVNAPYYNAATNSCSETEFSCPSGQHENIPGDGACLCDGTNIAPVDGVCVPDILICPAGLHANEAGTCICDVTNQSPAADGSCAPVVSCNADTEALDSGACVCKEGYGRYYHKKMASVEESKKYPCVACGNGVTKDKTYCICEPGFIRSETGACVAGDTPCAAENTLFEGACVPKSLVVPDCDAMAKATGKKYTLDKSGLICIEQPAGGGGGCQVMSGVAQNGIGMLLIIIPAAFGYALRRRKRFF